MDEEEADGGVVGGGGGLIGLPVRGVYCGGASMRGVVSLTASVCLS